MLEVGDYSKFGGWAWWWFLAEGKKEGRKEKKETRRLQVIGMQHGRYGADLGVVKREGDDGGVQKVQKERAR